MRIPKLPHRVSTVLLHTLVWGLVLLLPNAMLRYQDAVRGQPYHGPSVWGMLPLLLLLVGVFYLNAHFLMPRLLYRRGRLAYAAAVVALVVGVGYLGGLVSPEPPRRPAEESREHQRDEAREHHHGKKRDKRTDFRIFTTLFVLAVSAAYRLLGDRARAEEQARARENANLKTELAFLRGQISPHFLFNVLNSAVALARKKSDQLEPVLHRLSSLLRYMLYESDELRVPLDREVEYLSAYIELQLLRFGDTVQLDLDLPPHLAGHHIEPMLLIPFVENAFKHGVGLVPDPVISIRLRLDGPRLTFEVRNKVGPPDESLRTGPERNAGIGLGNVERRLKLLYPADHTLTIVPGPDWFTATLQLLLR